MGKGFMGDDSVGDDFVGVFIILLSLDFPLICLADRSKACSTRFLV